MGGFGVTPEGLRAVRDLLGLATARRRLDARVVGQRHPGSPCGIRHRGVRAGVLRVPAAPVREPRFAPGLAREPRDGRRGQRERL